jgi:hypothetical protein
MKCGKKVLVALVAGLATLALALVGCELDNADSVSRDVGADFSGFYQGDPAGSEVVSPHTGAEITSFNLRQTGDEIELIDNNGLIFRGTLGEVNTSGGTATSSFQFTGETTAGNAVTGSGTLTGSDGLGTMKGTWIEDTLYGTIYAQGTISLIPTNSPSPGGDVTLTVSISPSGAGSVDPASGSSFSVGEVVSVTATAAGTNIFTSWSGDLSGSGNPQSLTMNTNKSVTAHFNGL